MFRVGVGTEVFQDALLLPLAGILIQMVVRVIAGIFIQAAQPLVQVEDELYINVQFAPDREYFQLRRLVMTGVPGRVWTQDSIREAAGGVD